MLISVTSGTSGKLSALITTTFTSAAASELSGDMPLMNGCLHGLVRPGNTLRTRSPSAFTSSRKLSAIALSAYLVAVLPYALHSTCA